MHQVASPHAKKKRCTQPREFFVNGPMYFCLTDPNTARVETTGDPAADREVTQRGDW